VRRDVLFQQPPIQVDGARAKTGPVLPAAELNGTLRLIWPSLRAPQRACLASELVALFRRAGYVSDGQPEPAQVLMVYRGKLAATGDPGISWTTDLQIARRYAQGYAIVGDTRVMRATAPPAAILARFQRDAEVVVTPELLTDAQCLGIIPHFQLPVLR
jgi:hypothetical protein